MKDKYKEKHLVVFVSGHRDIKKEEFDEHYITKIDEILNNHKNVRFVVGDYKGVDTLSQDYLKNKNADVVVFYMKEKARYNAGFCSIGGFNTDEERDSKMTEVSDIDIAWIRPNDNKENSGTAINVKRRNMLMIK